MPHLAHLYNGAAFSARDQCARALLAEYFKRIYADKSPEYIRTNIEHLFDMNGFFDRLQYVVKHIDRCAYDCALVSGCAVGSESIAAKSAGFSEVYGVEISPEYVEIAKQRCAGAPGYYFDLYDGNKLPYAEAKFSIIFSGHIIEHTPNPATYLAELLRVLKKGGWIFMEFPTRYHWRELHTREISGEWLPEPFRTLVYRALTSRYSPLAPARKKNYAAIAQTLKPISVWQIRHYLRECGCGSSKIVAPYQPLPGFQRLLIKKQ